MALNFPGPDEIRIHYTVDGIVHVQRLNIQVIGSPDVGASFADIDVFDHLAAVTVSADALVDTWVGLMRPLFDDGDTTFDFAEIWQYAPNSFDATYLSSYQIGLAGLAGGPTALASEFIFTFRTGEGGIMRIQLEEQVVLPGATLGYPDLTAGQKNIVDFVLATSRYFLARDTSIAVAFIAAHPGQNERTFKRRFRS